ncbi:MAG: hypothetical protein U1F25_05515 [Rubrivivax sp.]
MNEAARRRDGEGGDFIDTGDDGDGAEVAPLAAFFPGAVGVIVAAR